LSSAFYEVRDRGLFKHYSDFDDFRRSHSSHDDAITEQALAHHRAWAWREIFKLNRQTGFDKFRSKLTEHVVQRF
jgi:hypothetical protein